MKFAYNEFYKKKGRGYTDAEIKAIFEKYTGENLDQFYKDYINGTEQLDMNKYMNYAGFELVDETRTLAQPYLGVVMESGNKIKNVSRGSSAWNGGLNVNDEVLAINGERVDDVLERVAATKVNETLNFMISRDGMIKNIEVTIKAAPNKSWRIKQMDKPTQQQRAVLEKWLSL
jgi:predicted metalloprotease with PDZ domain